jgi:hypothetical protein
VVFPDAPPGILYPGDPGIANTLAPIEALDFSPRVGLAWSPRRGGSKGGRLLAEDFSQAAIEPQS